MLRAFAKPTFVPDAPISPHNPEHHDAVPPPGPYVGKRSARAVEGSESRRIAGIVSRVRRVEVVILINVVYVKAQVEAQTLADGPLLRKLSLPPHQPRRLQARA